MITIPDAIITEMPSMSSAEVVCTILLASETYGKNEKGVWLTYSEIKQKSMLRSSKTIAKALNAVIQRGFFRRCENEGSNWEIVVINENETEQLFFCQEEGVKSKEEGVKSKEEGVKSKEEGVKSKEGSLLFTPDPQPSENCGPIFEPSNSECGPKIEPLPYRKEKLTNGKVRERERKRARARERPAKLPAKTKIPRPQTNQEKKLAKHPAAEVWLDVGFAWPGYAKLEVIARRMGKNPQKEKLRLARELWMMTGYRMANIGGILDWYEALCQDGTWRPFYRTTGQFGRSQGGAGTPDPTMAMLLEMQKELTHGKQTGDNAGAGNAESGIPAHAVWPRISDGLPDVPGGHRSPSAASSSIAACFNL